MSAPRSDLPQAEFLPTTRAEMERLGWEVADIVFVTGDAYVDHPSFAMAILGRVLEASGFRVAILSQPDWRSVEPFRVLGKPRLFFAVSAGNMDSMLNHYTARKKVRSDDAYSEGGQPGKRPDRATNVYVQRCKEAFPGAQVVAGGVEASLRRLAHYDYWSDKVRPSMLVSSKADLLVFGMGEKPIVALAQRVDRGESLRSIRDLRGTAHLLGRKETQPPLKEIETLELPSYEEICRDPVAFARATRDVHLESNPHNARRLTQRHGDRVVVQNPPGLPLSEAEMDAVYDLPYTREAHPSYRQPIPAMEMMRSSITTVRGCFGGCTFCSITNHQGRIIQSRSEQSVLREAERIVADKNSKGQISDVGGPTANMYRMNCSRPEIQKICRRLSCVHPMVCRLLNTEHGPLTQLLSKVRSAPGVRRALVASGVRMDLAEKAPEYLEEMAAHHVGGHLKVAPEHIVPEVLEQMKKPSKESFERFARAFGKASREAGKEQYLVPYFIAGHPGSTVKSMIELAEYLKQNGYRPRQVQDFIPAPMDLATAAYHTGIDPLTMKPVFTARGDRERKDQRALMQFFLEENWERVREILVREGREDLIGDGPQALILSRPPRGGRSGPKDRKEAKGGRDRSIGYRPGRKQF
ncbi:MAG: YgiQ family radical SAM protein [Planctomycetota bacterium]